MLVLILIAVWIAVLAPTVIRRVRDRGTDRSIVNFHDRMARLGGRGDPLVAPAHRLGVSDELPPREVHEFESNPPTLAPKLRVVPLDATFGQIERNLSWDDWSRAYSDVPIVEPTVRRAPAHAPEYRTTAYSRVPTSSLERGASPYGSKSQRSRRRRLLLELIGVAGVTTLLALVTGIMVVEVAALLSWIVLVGFLALMYYAMSTGMIETATVRPARLVNPRVETLYETESYEFQYEHYEPRYEPVAFQRSPVESLYDPVQPMLSEFDQSYDREAAEAFEHLAERRYARAL